MKDRLAHSHKKYQPDRTDILWNTDWGIPESGLSKEEAESKGLWSYEGRWVTPEDYAVLMDEFSAYRWIRILGVVWMAFGMLFAYWPAIPMEARFPLAFLFWLVGFGLIRFHYAAWFSVVGICIFGYGAILVNINPELMAHIMGLFVVISSSLYIVLRKRSRRIFLGAPESSEETDSKKDVP